MIVGNAISTDTRVIKTALALCDGGAEVTILGYSPTSDRTESQLGGVRLVRVPVPWSLRDATRTARAAAAKNGGSAVPEVARAHFKTLRARAGLRLAEQRDLGGATQSIHRAGSLATPYVDAVVFHLGKRLPRRARNWAERVRSGSALNDWRVVLPDIDDYTTAFRPVVDELEWDVIHAHDVHHMGLAAQAVAARRAQGRHAAWVYDAHEYVRGLSTYKGRPARKVRAYHSLEREFIRDADAVCTVSPELAARLVEQYALQSAPAVVMNAPDLAALETPVDQDIRAQIGLAADVPLMVYSGGVTDARGIQTCVAALPLLPGYHLAVVCVPHTRVAHASVLANLAANLGVTDRLHLLDPVRPDQVASFVRTADMGLIPIRRYGSHEVALANKLFEYSYAGLPVLVSDMEAQARFVTEHGIGLVHRVDDASSFAAEATRLMADRARFTANLRDGTRLAEYSWEQQAASLRRLYRDRLGLDIEVQPQRHTQIASVQETPLAATPAQPKPERARLAPRARARALDSARAGLAAMPDPVQARLRSIYRRVRSSASAIRTGPSPEHAIGAQYGFPPVSELPVRLLIAPVNSAGQGYQWARAAERHVPGVSAKALSLTNRYGFPADYSVTPEQYQGKGWGMAHQSYVNRAFTHVLIESTRTVFGRAYGNRAAKEIATLAAANIRIGLISHGSDTRVPSKHVEREPWSPFGAKDWDLVPKLEEMATRESAWMNAFTIGPVFVSTPDLLDDLPTASWLPLAVDLSVWGSAPTGFDRRRPVVVHAPSSSRMKGSELVDPIAERLHDAGLIAYRRLEGLTTSEMVATYREADIVLDQFRLGSYGAAACEAMAAGRIVVGHVSQTNRERVRAGTGLELPMVQATPDTLADVLTELVADRQAGAAAAAAGVEFVGRVHDGRMAADALTSFLAEVGA